jgi:hypothetical protein
LKRGGKEEAGSKAQHDQHECRRSWLWQIGAAPANEMHDFQFVAVLKRCRVPLGAGNDFKIQFHGYPVRLHAELRHQRRNGQAVRKVALFTIDIELHGEDCTLIAELHIRTLL